MHQFLMRNKQIFSMLPVVVLTLASSAGCSRNEARTIFLDEKGKELPAFASSNRFAMSKIVVFNAKQFQTPFSLREKLEEKLAKYLVDRKLKCKSGNEDILVEEWSAVELPSRGIFICGGAIVSREEKTVRGASWFFDYKDRKLVECAKMAKPCCASTLTLLPDNRILVSGGWENWSNTPIDTCQIYDPHTDTFSLAGRMCEPRALHGALLIGKDGVAIAGGECASNPDEEASTVELYDLKKQKSQSIGKLVSPRTKPIILKENDQVIVVGGWSRTNQGDKFWDKETETFSLP